MKIQQTAKRRAIAALPPGLPAIGGRILTGGLALLLIGAACGSRAWAITGGQPDANRHPNVGAIVVCNPAAPDEIHTISGTLIHPRVFLTAGHVVGMIESGQVILLGVTFAQEPNLGDPASWLQVASMAGAFTGFNADPHGNDIGALILAEPVEEISPARLPPAGLLDDLEKAGQLQAGPDGTRFTVVGYGMVLDWPPPHAYWPEPSMRNTAQSGYRALNDGWLLLSQSLALGYGGTARGDSGGPTFWTDPTTGQETLVSITSWGDGPCVAAGWTYRIDTARSLQFIQNVIDGLSPE